MTDRAVSSTLGYVLALGIMFLVTTGLFITGGNFVNEQRDQAIRSELQVVGQQMSNDISRVDRAVDASNPKGGDTVRFDEQIPRTVAGKPYTIELVTGASVSTPHLLLSTTDPDITVRVNVTASTSLSSAQIGGGQYSVVYDASADELTINDE